MTDDDAKSISDASKRLERDVLPRLKIVQRDFANGLDAEVIKGHANQLIRSTGASEILIIVDLFQKWDIQKCTPEGDLEFSRQDADVDRLDIISRILKTYQNAGIQLTFLVTSEVRKEAKTELTFDDLKGDGRMASDADTVLLMWPTDKNLANCRESVPLTLRIAKGRDGVRRGDLPILFHHTKYQFSSAPPVEKTNKGKQPVRSKNSTPDPLAE